jgi:allantoinase
VLTRLAGSADVLVVRGRRIVFPDGERAGSLHIDEGRIVDIKAFDEVPRHGDIVEAGDLVVLPGLVDSHVHVNEPGRTDWEGFDTATRAAAAGGITTIVDMPLNSVPPTITVDALETKRRAARGRCHVDVAFWGGIVPGNTHHIAALVEAGVRGFKCFMCPSGVNEFQAVDDADLHRALPELAGASGGRLPLLVHAEDPTALREASGDPRVFETFLRMRPAVAEVRAIERVSALAAEYHVPTHIVHVSSATALEAVSRARTSGAPVTAETCPHYLTFTAEDVPDGATAFKCAPPIRTRADRDALWGGLANGTCQLIASDHSPAPPSLKAASSGDFVAAWGGIASLELSLAAVWSGAPQRGFSAVEIARWMSEGPARLAGLADRKGAIRRGRDADLVVWNPEATFEVEGRRLQHRHKLTPYEGCRLRGAVVATYLRGERIWDADGLILSTRGQLL